MNITQKIAANTLIQLIGKVIVIGIGLAGFALIARYLGQTGYGWFTTVYGFLAVLGILVDMGLQMTTTQLISDPKNDEQEILSNALTLRAVASIIFMGLAPLLVLAFPYAQQIKLGVAAAAAGFVFHSLSSTLTSLFQKHLRMHFVVLADVAAKIVYLVFLIWMITNDMGLMGVIAATVLDAAVAFLLLFTFSQKLITLRPAFNKTIWKKILLFTWPLAATIALNLLYFKGDIIIMSLFRTQAEVGLYGAPYKILEVFINAIYLFLGLILPLMAAAVAAKNTERLKQVTQQVFDAIMLLAIPMVVGGAILGKPIMVLFAGSEFAISGELFKILILATAVIFIGALFGYAVVALGAQRQMIKFYILNAIVSLGAYFWLIPLHGYWAAAWITVASEALIMATAWHVLQKHTQFKINWNISGRALLCSLLMGGVLLWLSSWPVVLLITIGILVYLCAAVMLRAIPKQFLLEIFQRNA